MELTAVPQAIRTAGPYTCANRIQRGLFPTDGNKICRHYRRPAAGRFVGWGNPCEFTNVEPRPEERRATHLLRQDCRYLWILGGESRGSAGAFSIVQSGTGRLFGVVF